MIAEAVGAERLLREITTTMNLRHPNILPLLDSGEVDGVPFYLMPYAEGETRAGLLEQGRALTPAAVLAMVAA